jgi:proteasome lid subunit RPN8/RPN11
MKVSKAPAQDEEILWHENNKTYQPLYRKLPEFLSTIELASQEDMASISAAGPLLVFLEQTCIAEMQHHAGQDILREQAGILCGQAYLSDCRHYLVVESAMTANTSGDAVHFRFHQNSWQGMWSRLDNTRNIVGWYHSHPAMGIFLSATDLRTQQLYFSAPWQIAVVIDPVSHETGIFYGATGTKLAKHKCFTYVRKQQ